MDRLYIDLPRLKDALKDAGPADLADIISKLLEMGAQALLGRVNADPNEITAAIDLVNERSREFAVQLERGRQARRRVSAMVTRKESADGQLVFTGELGDRYDVWVPSEPKYSVTDREWRECVEDAGGGGWVPVEFLTINDPWSSDRVADEPTPER